MKLPKQKLKKKTTIKRKTSNVKVKNFKKLSQRNHNTKQKQKVDYGSLTVDDFMNVACDRSSDDSAQEEDHVDDDNHIENKPETKLWGEDEELDEGNSDEFENEITSHKASLEKLKETDPEFYKFLQDNDKKLLQFDISDSENEDDVKEQVHKPTGELEIASDESDFEADENEVEDENRRVVTLKMLKNWQADLQTDKTNKTISCVIHAFHAALLRVSNNPDEVPKYKVEGSSVFNGVIQLCVLELSPAIRRFLGLTSSKTLPHKCKKFVKVKSLLKSYFTDLLKLLGGVTSTNILTVLLKHLHHVSSMFVSFPNIAKPMIKKLINIWGTGDDVVRVLAFFCIIRITTNQMSLLDVALKSMYMTYVINSKFVSVNVLSSINFMRRSLVEMFALDPAVSYQHVFLYIRQLAIHLRNAIMVHKKDNIQTVYNWQFINSLKLWGNLLAVANDKPQLQPLVYPFVQVCLGTLKLVPTTQYYPLRFHVIQILIDFSKATGVFIPTLPFILEVLNSYDFNKKHKKASMKPLNLTCVLRLSNSQMAEHGFKDSLIDNVYALLLEYLEMYSHSISFPDLTLFCIIQLKQFTAKCTIANYTKKMKQILEKIKQNNEFIEKERKNVNFKLTDYDKIEAWETAVKNKGTPISVFYESWNKLRTIKKNKEATNVDKLADYNLPTVKKVKKVENKDAKKTTELFPSDSDSDDELAFDKNDKEKSNKKDKKKRRKQQKKKPEDDDVNDDNNDDDDQDVVEDLNIADW